MSNQKTKLLTTKEDITNVINDIWEIIRNNTIDEKELISIKSKITVYIYNSILPDIKNDNKLIKIKSDLYFADYFNHLEEILNNYLDIDECYVEISYKPIYIINK